MPDGLGRQVRIRKAYLKSVCEEREGNKAAVAESFGKIASWK